MSTSPSSSNHEWAVLLAASLAMFLNTVDISILNVAMPVIQRDLDIETTLLQWLQGAYGLPYAGFLLLSGRLADLVGRRRIFITGVALFGFASLTGSIAPGFSLLLVARAVQGIGAALMVPSAISIISTTFEEGQHRTRALGIFSAVAATGFSSGLAAGALITEFASWRWVFFVNVPITAVILAIAPFAVRRDGAGHRAPIDILGAALVTAGLLVIVYAITTLGEKEAVAIRPLGWFTLAAILMTAFAFHERHHPSPLIPLSMFAMPSLRAASLASLALLGSAFGFFFLASLYLQLAAGFTALEAGFALLPMSVVSALVSGLVAPWIVGRFGARLTLAFGLVLNALGCALFALSEPEHALVMTIIASVVLGGFGMGLGYPASNLTALEGIAGNLQGAASGIQNTFLQTGGAIGTAMAATVLSSFGAPFATLAPIEQAGARTFAAIILTTFALFGALTLITTRKAVKQGECTCRPSLN